MKCPACGEEVKKLLRGGLCPNNECKAPLKKAMREDEKGDLVETLEFRKPRDSQDDDDVEKFTTTYNFNGVKVEKSDKDNFIVTYTRKMFFNWIYCPSCESKMFQNNMLIGSQEHKCHKCKAITTYVFK